MANQINKLKQTAKESLRDFSGYRSVGIKDGKIVVYIDRHGCECETDCPHHLKNKVMFLENARHSANMQSPAAEERPAGQFAYAH